MTDGPSSPYTPYRPTTEVMTRSGAYTATGVLLAVLLVGGVVGWLSVSESPTGDVNFPAWLLLPMFAALGVAILLAFKPKLAMFLGPVYAILQGVVLGAISHVYEAQWDGIVLQAIGITAAVTAGDVPHLRHRPHQGDRQDRARSSSAPPSASPSSTSSRSSSACSASTSPTSRARSLWSIGLSVVIAGVAAFNLMLDFDLVDRGAAAGAPKYMEWYAAFGLMVTRRVALPGDPAPARQAQQPVAGRVGSARSAGLVRPPGRAATTVPRSPWRHCGATDP